MGNRSVLGLHHVTAITADAPRNVDFYAGTLGLRLVKKTVNHDAPDVYHLYYGDERGTPGTIMTFFEFPGAAPGRPGAGMVHTVAWRVAGAAALDSWAARLQDAGRPVERGDGVLRSSDPEGLRIELIASAEAGLQAEHGLLEIAGVRAHALAPERSAGLLSRLGLADGPLCAYDPPPAEHGIQGAGSVHHVAWASADDDLDDWRSAVREAGARPTPIIDRLYFRSVYFREPSGVLFELATLGPGFAVDEPADRLGESLVLPPRHEHLRARLERSLTPVASPRRRV